MTLSSILAKMKAPAQRSKRPKQRLSGRKAAAKQTGGAVALGGGGFSYSHATGLIWKWQGTGSERPSPQVRARLKASGMRWFPKKSLWWLPGTFNQPLSTITAARAATFKKAIGFDPRTLE